MNIVRDTVVVNDEWTLFLDRDGVINRRIPGAYISDPLDLEFLPGVLDSLAHFSKIFRHLIVVTNQQGIGRGLMTVKQLETLHNHMLSEISTAGGCIDGIYYCSDVANQSGNCRKPSPVMAYRAKVDFHDIDFDKSIMVGDTIADVGFGQNLGMKTVLVGEQLGYPDPEGRWEPDYILNDLVAVRSILFF